MTQEKRLNYSNRELDLMFKGISSQITEVHRDVKTIDAQTKLTNGRVNKLENWKWFISGGLAIITILILPVVFIIVKAALEKQV